MKHLLAVLLLLGLTLPAMAQTGKVRGTVTDCDSNEPIAGVVVAVQDSTLNLKATTDAKGQFVLSDLPAGEYVLLGTHEQYDEIEIKGVRVVAGAVSRMDFLMQKKRP
jgi:hypothetical protein